MGIEPDFLTQWAEFNRIKWGCEPILSRFNAPDSEAYCESLLFLNKSGKLYLPPLNQYHPTMFYPTATVKGHRINNQWHKVADEVSKQLLKVGGSASFILPPNITDIRPFLWRGFRIDVKYTYKLKFPYVTESLDGKVRYKINRAESLGYRSMLTTNVKDAYESLISTELRQGFKHQMTLADLELARSLLGDHILRCYVCYSPEGDPASASISIIINDRQAIGWIAGSKSAHLKNGVVQHLQNYGFTQLASQGIREFDFCGANIASVADSKSYWGGELTPYYAIRVPGYKDVLRAGRQWLTFNKQIAGH